MQAIKTKSVKGPAMNEECAVKIRELEEDKEEEEERGDEGRGGCV